MTHHQERLESLLPEKWKGKSYLLPLPKGGASVLWFVLAGAMLFGIKNYPEMSYVFALCCLLGILTMVGENSAKEKYIEWFSRMTPTERDAYLTKLQADASSSAEVWPQEPEYETEEHIHYRKTKPGFERGFYGPEKEVGRTIVRRKKR